MNRIANDVRDYFTVYDPQKAREDSQKNMMHPANTAGEWIIQAFYQLKSDIMTVSGSLSPFQPSKLPETKGTMLDPDAAKKGQEDVWKKRFIYTTIGIAGLAAIVFGLYQFGCFSSKTELLNQQQLELKLAQQAENLQRTQEKIESEKARLQQLEKSIGKQELQQKQQQLKLAQQAENLQRTQEKIESEKARLQQLEKSIGEQEQQLKQQVQLGQQASKTQEKELKTLQQQLTELEKKQNKWDGKLLEVNTRAEQLNSQAKELEKKQNEWNEKLLKVNKENEDLTQKLQDQDLQNRLTKLEEKRRQIEAMKKKLEVESTFMSKIKSLIPLTITNIGQAIPSIASSYALAGGAITMIILLVGGAYMVRQRRPQQQPQQEQIDEDLLLAQQLQQQDLQQMQQQIDEDLVLAQQLQQQDLQQMQQQIDEDLALAQQLQQQEQAQQNQQLQQPVMVNGQLGERRRGAMVVNSAQLDANHPELAANSYGLLLELRNLMGVNGLFPRIRYEGQAGVDAGGLTRDFIARLCKVLCRQEQNQLPLIYDEATLRYMPTIRIGQGAISEAQQIKCYQALGAIFARALSDREVDNQGQHVSVTTGKLFDDAMFEMLHSLTEAELGALNNPNMPWDQIPEGTAKKLARIYLQRRYPAQFLPEGQPLSDEVFSGFMLSDLNNALVQAGMNEDFLNDNVKGPIRSTLIIAKSMLQYLYSNQNWNQKKGATSRVLEENIQGVFSKDHVIHAFQLENINLNQVDNNPNTRYLRYLKQWINESPLETVQRLALAISGSDSVAVNQHFVIRKCNPALMPPQDQGCSHFHTCFFTIDLADHADYAVFKEKLDTSIYQALLAGNEFGIA